MGEVIDPADTSINALADKHVTMRGQIKVVAEELHDVVEVEVGDRIVAVHVS